MLAPYKNLSLFFTPKSFFPLRSMLYASTACARRYAHAFDVPILLSHSVRQVLQRVDYIEWDRPTIKGSGLAQKQPHMASRGTCSRLAPRGICKPQRARQVAPPRRPGRPIITCMLEAARILWDSMTRMARRRQATPLILSLSNTMLRNEEVVLGACILEARWDYMMQTAHK